MGVSFTQYAVIGLKLQASKCLVREADLVYEDQNRYDTKTGKKIGTERILVKEAIEYYQYKDIKQKYFYEFIEDIANKYDLNYVQSENIGVVGRPLDANSGDYSFDGIDCSITIEELNKIKNQVESKIGEGVQLHLLYNIG